MATQREVPYTGTTKCVCGKVPKAYITDGKLPQVECYPCQHITMRLSTPHAANAEFARMMEVKRRDSLTTYTADLGELEARVVAYFNRGSRA
jgi:hypothetical protein